MKTHFADDATLALIAKLEAENAALRDALEAECKQPVTIYTLEGDARVKELIAENEKLRRRFVSWCCPVCGASVEGK